NAAQRRIGGECSEERLRGNQISGGALHLVQTEEEDAVALEELAAIRAVDTADQVRPGPKLMQQRIRRLIGGLRRGRIDNCDDLVNPLRKPGIQDHLLLTPWQ